MFNLVWLVSNVIAIKDVTPLQRTPVHFQSKSADEASPGRSGSPEISQTPYLK